MQVVGTVRVVTSRIKKTTNSLENEGYCEALMGLGGNKKKQMLFTGHQQKGRAESSLFQD